MVNFVLIILILHIAAFAIDLPGNAGKKAVIITSQSLTADNKNHTAIFEGSVVAKTGGITMYSDEMTVFYDNSESKIKKIHAIGNVRVLKNERALFSEEATYFEDEGKIIFTGNPKAVEGENVITGTQIIFYLKDDRAVVEGSRVILQNKQGLK
ncbi:MAG TPA: hypothetical protein ENH24_01040 [Nitrospirae bacterium]|nr:hypothetical protein [Nitrospirota bacterium]